MSSPDDLVAVANELLRGQRLDDAEATARRACAVEPRSAEAENTLGTILVAKKDEAGAEAAYRRASTLDPRLYKPFANLGNLLSKRGDFEGAVAMYERAIELEPRGFRAHAGLGGALAALGRELLAIESFRRSLELQENPAAALGLASLLASRGAPDEARAVLESCRRRAPDDPRWGDAFANVEARAIGSPEKRRMLAKARDRMLAGEHADAARLLDEMLRHPVEVRDPVTDEALELSWRAKRAAGDEAGALEAFTRALAEGDATSSYERVAILEELDRTARATALQAAVSRAPEREELWRLRAIELMRARRLTAAETLLATARSRHPDSPELRELHASALVLLGRQEEGVELSLSALDRDPDARPTSNTLLGIHYVDRLTRAETLALHRRWAAPLDRVRRMAPAAMVAGASGRLRVGYVSGDFFEHSVGRLLLPVLERHDRSRFEIFAYMTNPKRDATTAEIERAVDCFRGVWSLDDEALAHLVRRDGIDLLVDLSGHTAMNRLGAFAHKPARVQLTHLGYPDTTGLGAIDYRITDAEADPPDADAYAVETLLRLPRPAWCFAARAPFDTPEPAGEGVVFGSFNSTAKITRAVVASWSRIVSRVPAARLLLKSTNLLEEGARDQWQRRFEAEGLDAPRVELLAYEPDRERHLETYRRIDVALDPFPYNGTMTTCEALSMGVPVVTLRGDRHVARVGASLLSGVGLPELVADSREEYEELAVRLGTDPARRAALSARLSKGFASSRLADVDGFTRALETAFDEAARRGPRT